MVTLNPPDQRTRPILWTVRDGNPNPVFTVPNNCAHANENRAQSGTTSAANLLKNHGHHERTWS